jgi:DNA-binding transcriptional LysR family regulator
VAGSLITGESDLAVRAALDGIALARVPRHTVEAHLAAKSLVAVLEDWRPRSVGFYLYYSSRRQMPAALQALIDTLKAELSARRTNPALQPRAAKAAAATVRMRSRT